MAEKDSRKVVPNPEVERLAKSVDEVLRTEAGRALWVHLFHLCGYNTTSLSRKNDGEVAPLSTECKEAQRLVYIRLRGLASPELRAVVEQMAEAPVAAPKPEEERK